MKYARWTTVDNSLFDKELSYGAIGLFMSMFSKPDNWRFSIEELATEKDGRKKILGFYKELKTLGFLKIKRLKTGEVEYHFDPTGKFEKTMVKITNEPVKSLSSLGESRPESLSSLGEPSTYLNKGELAKAISSDDDVKSEKAVRRNLAWEVAEHYVKVVKNPEPKKTQVSFFLKTAASLIETCDGDIDLAKSRIEKTAKYFRSLGMENIGLKKVIEYFGKDFGDGDPFLEEEMEDYENGRVPIKRRDFLKRKEAQGWTKETLWPFWYKPKDKSVI